MVVFVLALGWYRAQKKYGRPANGAEEEGNHIIACSFYHGFSDERVLL